MAKKSNWQEIRPFITERIEAEIPSRLQYVNPLVSYIVERLIGLGYIECESNISIALYEAITNAIRHGNRMESSKKVNLVVDVDKERAVFTITDEGQGFDPSRVGDPTEGENLFRHSGRGLLLIRHYMDEVRYNRRGNQVTMIMKSPRTVKT